MTMGSRGWLAVTLLAALLDWVAVGLALLPLEYLAKPATLIGVMGYAHALSRTTANPRLARWIQVGLGLSLLGDVCLMFSGEGWFLAGLVSFLLAHVAYIVGLAPTRDVLGQPGTALIVLGVGAIATVFLGQVVRALREQDQAALIGPVLLYGAVISTMLATAWTTLVRPGWSGRGRALVTAGTGLFYFSDAVLAWNRFVTPLAGGRLAVIVSYHLAQLALASVVRVAPVEGV